MSDQIGAYDLPGSIVSVSSIAPYIGFAERCAHRLSKDAMDAMTVVMVNELGSVGIHLNAVNPVLNLTR